MPTFPKMTALLLGGLLMAASCSSGGGEPVEVGQAGTRPTETTESTTTTTEVLTTTTLAPAIIELVDLPEWGTDWEGPSSDLGPLKMQEFNEFVVANAPDQVDSEEAIAVYLQLDPDDTNTQMLSGESGTPGASTITVVINVQDDDSVRALRYDFLVERRARDFAQVEDAEGEAAETGDTAEVDDELDSNEGDVATEEDLAVVDGPDGIPWVLSGELSVQCQPGRGHQDFTVETCV